MIGCVEIVVRNVLANARSACSVMSFRFPVYTVFKVNDEVITGMFSLSHRVTVILVHTNTHVGMQFRVRLSALASDGFCSQDSVIPEVGNVCFPCDTYITCRRTTPVFCLLAGISKSLFPENLAPILFLKALNLSVIFKQNCPLSARRRVQII